MAFTPLSPKTGHTKFHPESRGMSHNGIAFVSGVCRPPPTPQSEPEIPISSVISIPQPEPEPVPPPLTPADIEALQQTAYDTGRESAIAELREQVARLEREFSVLGPLIEELTRAHKRQVSSADDTIATLVLSLARRIAGESLVLHPDAVPNVVRAALERLPEEDEIWIRVPPHTVERVRASINPKYRAWVVPDDTLSAGALVETRQIQIDATLDAATQGVANAIRAWLESRA